MHKEGLSFFLSSVSDNYGVSNGVQCVEIPLDTIGHHWTPLDTIGHNLGVQWCPMGFIKGNLTLYKQIVNRFTNKIVTVYNA